MKEKVLMIVSVTLLLFLAIYFIFSSKNVWVSDKNTTEFKLIFIENKNIGKKKIISNNFFNKDSYNVYLYNGEIKVIIDNKEYDLIEALNKNILTTQDLLNKAKQECLFSAGFSDGGTMEYYFKEFTIIKYNVLTGNKDLYIGSKDLNYSIGENHN